MPSKRTYQLPRSLIFLRANGELPGVIIIKCATDAGSSTHPRPVSRSSQSSPVHDHASSSPESFRSKRASLLRNILRRVRHHLNFPRVSSTLSQIMSQDGRIHAVHTPHLLQPYHTTPYRIGSEIQPAALSAEPPFPPNLYTTAHCTDSIPRHNIVATPCVFARSDLQVQLHKTRALIYVRNLLRT
jgi:hypothetical protein